MRPARYNEVVRKQDSVERRWAMKEEQSFKPDEMVEIINGPFTKLTGEVRDVNGEKQMLAVIVKAERIEGIILGEILIELGFQEVMKRPDMISW
jgi:transcription antitermination factor NusG